MATVMELEQVAMYLLFLERVHTHNNTNTSHGKCLNLFIDLVVVGSTADKKQSVFR